MQAKRYAYALFLNWRLDGRLLSAEPIRREALQEIFQIVRMRRLWSAEDRWLAIGRDTRSHPDDTKAAGQYAEAESHLICRALALAAPAANR